MQIKINKVKLDKGANVFPAGLGNFHCKTVRETVHALEVCDMSSCIFQFNINHAPNEKRAFNAMVKRCRTIAEQVGVTLSEPAPFVEQGVTFPGQFRLDVIVPWSAGN